MILPPQPPEKLGLQVRATLPNLIIPVSLALIHFSHFLIVGTKCRIPTTCKSRSLFGLMVVRSFSPQLAGAKVKTAWRKGLVQAAAHIMMVRNRERREEPGEDTPLQATPPGIPLF